MAESSSSAASTSAGKEKEAPKKVPIELKKWNAVALWSWGLLSQLTVFCFAFLHVSLQLSKLRIVRFVGII
jgi:hypothetical protein